jgi:hypothetical protein
MTTMKRAGGSGLGRRSCGTYEQRQSGEKLELQHTHELPQSSERWKYAVQIAPANPPPKEACWTATSGRRRDARKTAYNRPQRPAPAP